MSEDKLTVDRAGDRAVIHTRGYINNVGGEEIANSAYELMNDGVRTLILDLKDTKIVNSIGISILIEIVEKMMEKDGKVAFCCLTPVIQKTFQIMGLAQYAAIYQSEDEARAELSF